MSEPGARHEPSAETEEVQPRGTMVFLVLFLLAIAVTFAWTYYTLIDRG